MECPKCGAENPEGAEYCSLCLEKLAAIQPSYEGTQAPSHPSTYMAPSEWRGDADLAGTGVSKVVARKMKRLHLKIAIYGVLVIGVAAWLVLSLTIWGNPSPGKQASKLINALNERNAAAFNALVLPEENAQGQPLYDNIVLALGSDGQLENVTFSVAQPDNYTAQASITGGRITSSVYGPIDLAQQSALVLVFENHKGKWYFEPAGSSLIPY
jgi:hypothetical protein